MIRKLLEIDHVAVCGKLSRSECACPPHFAQCIWVRPVANSRASRLGRDRQHFRDQFMRRSSWLRPGWLPEPALGTRSHGTAIRQAKARRSGCVPLDQRHSALHRRPATASTAPNRRRARTPNSAPKDRRESANSQLTVCRSGPCLGQSNSPNFVNSQDFQ